jgi:glycosyltransferase involved in cell wall biosynthesis
MLHKLSIITINYNNDHGLQKTILSVVNQNFKDFEYIVIDGGSSDGSKETIVDNSSRMTYWVSEKDNGIYHAMNKGIKNATGEYCLFLNSGDYLVDKNVLSHLFANKLTKDIVYGDMKINKGNGNLELGRMPNRMGIYQLYRDTLWHPVSFIKRDLFSKYGDYDESFKIVADYEFFVKTILFYKVSTQHISQFISVFDSSGISSHVNNKNEILRERSKVQEKYFNSMLLFLFRMYSKLRE